MLKIFLTCRSAATWRIDMYQIGNCACTKTAHTFWRCL